MSISETERINIHKLTFGLFNAAPGAFYLSEMSWYFEDSGRDYHALARLLETHPATVDGFNTLYPTSQTPQQFALAFTTLLGLQNEPEAVEFVLVRLANGQSRAEAIVDTLSALLATNDPRYSESKQLLANKAEVSDYYSLALEGNAQDLTTLQTVIAGVTADPVSVYTAKVALTPQSSAPSNPPLTPPTTTIATAGLSDDSGASGSDFITKTAAQTVSGTLSANLATGETVQVSFDGGATWLAATAAALGNAWSYDTTLVGSGTFKARVISAGGSGQEYSQTYALDTTPPTAPTITSGNLTKNATPVISGKAPLDAVSVLVTVAGATYQVTPGTGGSWSLDLANPPVASGTLNLDANGNNAISATAVDLAGNVSTTGATQTLKIDTTPPSTPTLTSGALTTPTPIFKGTAAGANYVDVKIYIDGDSGSPFFYRVAVVNGTWSLDVVAASESFSPMSVGQQYTVELIAGDAAGNTAQTANPLSLSVKAVPAAPTIQLFNDTGISQTDNITSDGRITVSGLETAPGTTWEYAIGSGAWQPGSAITAQGESTLTITQEGSSTLKVRQTDVAGNVSLSSSNLTLLIDTAAPKPVRKSTGDAISISFGEVIYSQSTITAYFINESIPASKEQNINGHTSLSFSRPDAENVSISFGFSSSYYSTTDIAGNKLPAFYLGGNSADSVALSIEKFAAAPSIMIDTGAGDDTVTLKARPANTPLTQAVPVDITLGTGSDKIVLESGFGNITDPTDNGISAGLIVVNDFVRNTDSIIFNGPTATGRTTLTTSTASLTSIINTMLQHPDSRELNLLQIGNDTYIHIDTNNSRTFDAGDALVKFVGVTLNLNDVTTVL